MANLIISTGDDKHQLQNWSLDVTKQSATDGGKQYVNLTTGGLGYQVQLYSDSDQTALVALGSVTSATGDAGVTVTLGEQNSSGTSGSVWLQYSASDSNVKVYPYLAIDTDLELEEKRITDLYISVGGTQRTHFNDFLKEAREEIVRHLLRVDRWRYFEQMTDGTRQWECNRLHQPEVFRRAAAAYALHRIYHWHHNAIDDADLPGFGRWSDFYLRKYHEYMERVAIEVDRDKDGTPETLLYDAARIRVVRG